MSSRAAPFVLMVLALLPMSNSANAAGPPPQPNAAQLRQGLRKLGVVGSVLYVAAHPDDENTSLLAYLANGALVRTAYLSLTRGDGGQNLIGAEQGPALGLIRTQELLAARRIDGAEQFFTRARDFGYSKSPEETLRIWGREAVLADMVAVIRRFRPDVIITRFSPEPSDTHGHHTASAILAVEAFRAAGDPAFHPEQLTGGVGPWQARRLLWNKSSWNTKPGEDLAAFGKLDVGGYNAVLGESYGEMAADSRSMHKSQGFGVARARGPIVEYFKVLAEAGSKPTKNGGATTPIGPLDGLDLSWGRFAGTARLRAAVERLQRRFDAAAPHASIPALLEVDTALDAVADAGWRAQKQREVRALLLACAGLFADATAGDFRAAPGGAVEITATAVNRSPAALTLKEIRFPADGGTVAVGKRLVAAAAGAATPAFEVKRTVHLPADVAPTTPYWLELPPGPGLYQVADPALIGAPEGPPALRVDFVLGAGARSFTVTRAVSYRWTDPVMGERYRPLEIEPLVAVRPDARTLLFPDGDPAPQALAVHLTAVAPVSGVLRPTLPPGWSSEPAAAPFSLTGAQGTATVSFRIRRSGAGAGATPATARLVAEVGAARSSRGVVRIEHAHIPVQTLLVDADVKLVPLSLATGGVHKIGYIPGPGDEVPASLRRAGYEVAELGDAALAAGGAALARFDAVVVGVRAFNTNPALGAAHAALMAYVEAGGTLVVQYNTNNRLAPLSAAIGPWPFEIGRERVTDEEAPVTFVSAAHPALTTPNQMTARDFEGWIQERGLYFAEKWDPRYQTVLTMHDPGEPPLGGSVLWARHGQGTFVYTGLAFFRQLPAGVPGAFRLFANLLAGGSAHHGR